MSEIFDTKKITRIIMNNPISSILTALSLLVAMPISIVVLNFTKIISFGFMGVILFGLIFSAIPYCLWLFITYLNNRISFYKKKVSETNFEFNEYMVSWSFVIEVGSFVNLLFILIVLAICYYMKISFKNYYLILLSIPILRMFILFLDYKYIKKQSLK
jgi:hypothetical protein